MRADNCKEDLRRQNVVIAAEDKRVAEIRHAFDEAKQKGVGKSGADQRFSDTVFSTCIGDARNVCAASSIDGLTLSTTPISTRKAIGV